MLQFFDPFLFSLLVVSEINFFCLLFQTSAFSVWVCNLKDGRNNKQTWSLANWTLWLLFWFRFFLFSFSFLFFSFLFFSFLFLCFIRFERRRGGCVEIDDQKYITLSFQFKINSFFFVLKKGGTSLCLWGFLCPLCLHLQEWNYSFVLADTSSKNPLTESQFERYPPWTCRGIAFCSSESAFILCLSYCLCLYGAFVGSERHEKYSPRAKFEYYCSSQRWCCRCCHTFTVEDCLIGYFCCCCSIIQVTMAMDEEFRMKSKVEGDVNIKRALWKERKKVLIEEKRNQFGKTKTNPQRECSILYRKWCSIWVTKSTDFLGCKNQQF